MPAPPGVPRCRHAGPWAGRTSLVCKRPAAPDGQPALAGLRAIVATLTTLTTAAIVTACGLWLAAPSAARAASPKHAATAAPAPAAAASRASDIPQAVPAVQANPAETSETESDAGDDPAADAAPSVPAPGTGSAAAGKPATAAGAGKSSPPPAPASTTGATRSLHAGGGAAATRAAGTAAAPSPAARRVRLAAVPAKGLRVRLDAGAEAHLTGDGQISIEAQARHGEGFAAFAQRWCGDSRLLPQLLEANHLRAGARPVVAKLYHVPFEILAAPLQLKAAQALYPEDRGDATGWRHQARGVGALRRESLWQLSEWFTGKGENFRAIREYNNLHDEEVAQGAVLTIPSELLRPAFGAALVVPQKPIALDYGKDESGEYAIYRLRPGEALYSGVVVRFTGRIYAADVNALAADIAHRSGIDDVTAIPVGFKVKIPLELLQPEFLPEGDPRRKEYEAGLRASSQFSNQVQARGLEGITVVLDAGHGGLDSGATNDGVWESLYVYDIVVRVKRLLETRTAASVRLTTRDGDEFNVPDADVLPSSRRHAVLTTPPYPIEDPVVGVNLRWYLANSWFRRALAADNDPQKVVFLSIHADSLHPSLRGAMAYIPAARMRNDSYGKSGAVYEARAEFRESPRVDFPWNQRVESEGLSRQLAKQIIGAFEELNLPVHPFDPVRDHIIRKRTEWVPAVLRYNSVPAKMLLEVCNLNNDLDRRLLQTRPYRQHVAEAVVDGLRAYYGQSASQPALRVARAAAK